MFELTLLLEARMMSFRHPVTDHSGHVAQPGLLIFASWLISYWLAFGDRCDLTCQPIATDSSIPLNVSFVPEVKMLKSLN